MKVNYIGDYYKVSHKKGKTYSVEREIDGMYCIVDESGDQYAFPKEEFEIVDDIENDLSPTKACRNDQCGNRKKKCCGRWDAL